MLNVTNLSVSYGKAKIVEGFTFEVGQGEIVTLIGLNGSGKSSILRAISGIIKSSQGQIFFDGEEITNHPSHSIYKKCLVQVPETRMIFSSLTVEENLLLGTNLNRRLSQFRIDDVLDLFPMLVRKLREPAAILSGGQLQMLALARGFVSNPKLIMLDEPSLGLSPDAIKNMFNIIQKIRDRGLAILLIEQNLRQAIQVADRAYMIENGELIDWGVPNTLLSEQRLLQKYI